jgi:ribosomal protein S28E/S33
MPIRIGDVTIISATIIANSSRPLFQKIFLRGESEFSKVIRRFGVTGDDGVVFQNAARIFIGWRWL